jgi:hypothetical protein
MLYNRMEQDRTVHDADERPGFLPLHLHGIAKHFSFSTGTTNSSFF